MKKKDIHDKIIKLLQEAYVDDVPNVQPDKEIKTHMPIRFQSMRKIVIHVKKWIKI